MNTWKVKIWLSKERKELSRWNKKHSSLFHKCFLLDIKKTSKNVADTTFKVKNKFAKLLFVYTFEPVDDVFCIFPLIPVEFMSKFFLHCLHNKFTEISEFIFCWVNYPHWRIVLEVFFAIFQRDKTIALTVNAHVLLRSSLKQSSPPQTVRVRSLFPGTLLILIRTIPFDFSFLFPR